MVAAAAGVKAEGWRRRNKSTFPFQRDAELGGTCEIDSVTSSLCELGGIREISGVLSTSDILSNSGCCALDGPIDFSDAERQPVPVSTTRAGAAATSAVKVTSSRYWRCSCEGPLMCMWRFNLMTRMKLTLHAWNGSSMCLSVVGP